MSTISEIGRGIPVSGSLGSSSADKTSLISPPETSAISRVGEQALQVHNYTTAMQWWRDKLVSPIDSLDGRIDQIQSNLFQRKLDRLGAYIEALFEPLRRSTAWLDAKEAGAWYQQLAALLVKLPLRSARNIIRLLYSAIKEACYAPVHPLKAATKLARCLVNLIYALTVPEVWAKIGAGIVGGTLGYGVFGNPMSMIGIGIGAAMIVGGVSLGAVLEAIEAKKNERWHAAKEFLVRQAQELPESFLTSFLMGLIIGGIQRAIASTVSHHISSEEARQLADDLVRSNNLPPYSSVSVTPDGKVVTITWTGEGIHANELKQFFIRIGNKNTCFTPVYDEQMEKVSLTIHNTGKYAQLYYYWQDRPLIYSIYPDDPPGVFHTIMGTFTWKEWFGRHMGFNAVGSVDGLSLGWKIPSFPSASIPGVKTVLLAASSMAAAEVSSDKRVS